MDEEHIIKTIPNKCLYGIIVELLSNDTTLQHNESLLKVIYCRINLRCM